MGDPPPREQDPPPIADQISHELGTALALIAGYAESLRDALGPDTAGTEAGVALEGIERGVARLRGVSDRLSSWARAGGVEHRAGEGTDAG